MCEMTGSMAKHNWSNVRVFYACDAVPGLTHPSQALSNMCSPPPSKTSIFGHFYMVNLIHKHWDKQLHRCTHTLQLLTPNAHTNIRIHPCIYSEYAQNYGWTKISAQPFPRTCINVALQKSYTCHIWVHTCWESILQKSLCGPVLKIAHHIWFLNTSICRYLGS